MDAVIRPPKAEDAEGLARAAHDLAAQYASREPDRFRVPELANQVAALRSHLGAGVPDDVIWLVAEVAGEAVGDARARLYEASPETALESRRDIGRRRAYLEWIAVQSRYRRKGLGGRLLRAVEERARESGAELINLGTNLKTDFGAVKFFERHGYEKQAVILRKPFR